MERELRFFNTLTKKVELFKPLKEGEVGLYACGPTVYDDWLACLSRFFVIY